MDWCPGLSDKQASRLVALLPRNRDLGGNAAAEAWALDEIERARAALWQADRESPHLLTVDRVRRATRRRIRNLSSAIDSLLNSLAELEPLDLQLLTRRGEHAATAMDQRLKNVMALRYQAGRVLEQLGRLPRKRQGRPSGSRAERAFVRSLSTVWVYFAGRSTSLARSGTTGKWRFQEFVSEVGKTVLPGFSGEAACRELVSKNRAIRRRATTNSKVAGGNKPKQRPSKK
jgi:hypothetical protein